jgi:phage terminase Nu1 subunit (DNA packaging protein)
VIRDVGLATEEWQTRSRPRLVNGHASNGRVATPSALAFQTMRERRARADHFEFETQRKKGEWVRTRDVEHRWAMIAVTTRTALLGIPSRARGRLPHLTALDVAVLDGLVRECLAELADTPPRDPAPRGPANASPSDAQEETP